MIVRWQYPLIQQHVTARFCCFPIHSTEAWVSWRDLLSRPHWSDCAAGVESRFCRVPTFRIFVEGNDRSSIRCHISAFPLKPIQPPSEFWVCWVVTFHHFSVPWTLSCVTLIVHLSISINNKKSASPCICQRTKNSNFQLKLLVCSLVNWGSGDEN